MSGIIQIISAGPSARMVPRSQVRRITPTFGINNACCYHEVDWVCTHDPEILKTAWVPRSGYITSPEVYHDEWPLMHPARMSVPTMLPWRQRFNFTFPIVLATILASWDPDEVFIQGVDMLGDTFQDCMRQESKSRTKARWEKELEQLTLIWSPVLKFGPYNQIPPAATEKLHRAGETNGRWHDKKHQPTRV